MPFAVWGATIAGPKGVIAGVGVGSVAFGLAALATAFWTVRTLERRAAAVRAEVAEAVPGE
jgi:nicotinamide mononucleotide (NMN) deamidase PncC